MNVGAERFCEERLKQRVDDVCRDIASLHETADGRQLNRTTTCLWWSLSSCRDVSRTDHSRVGMHRG